MTKFKFMAATCAAAAMFAVGASFSAPSAFAQSKTLKIIVPYTPGSGPDIISRLMGEQIQKAGGPTIVVENRPGGGMTIGTEAAARAEPDGNTLLLVANAFVVNMAVKRGNFTLAQFRAGLQSRLDADAARGAGLGAVEDGAGTGRRRQGQSGQNYLC